jgi:hypothetical protein
MFSVFDIAQPGGDPIRVDSYQLLAKDSPGDGLDKLIGSPTIEPGRRSRFMMPPRSVRWAWSRG